MLNGPTDLPVFNLDISFHYKLQEKNKNYYIQDYSDIPLGYWIHLVFDFLGFYQYWQNNH